MARPHLCAPDLLARDLGDRTYLVTGANAGIGEVTARQLAKQGARVILACRRLEEGERAAAAIASDTGNNAIEAMRLDLGDLASVRAFAAAFLATHERLDGLVNNAGVMNTPKGTTKDGFETQLGVNHFGHFLLTSLLLDQLKASAPSRIVNVSSCFHDKAMGREGVIDFDDLHFERREYDGWTAYAQSKLANLLHARGLAARLEGTGVTAVSLHPGWVRTNLMRHSMPLFVQNYILRPLLRWQGMIEPWEGAQTTLHALLSDDVPEQAGAYFSQLGVYRDASCNRGGWPMRSPNPVANDDDVVERFWQVSEAAVAG
jgi:NAD(P)-dependent dehydrogenase (short-subunit alcohol dehydrogenase family)